jgi:hypothetical protein
VTVEIPFSLTGNGTSSVLIVFKADGSNVIVPPDHPRFDEIFQGLVVSKPQDASVVDLIDLNQLVERVFTPISQNITVLDGEVFFDGDPIDPLLSSTILDFLDEGDAGALVNFTEKLYTNIDADVRENLFRWLKNVDLTLTPDGNIIGYKGLTSNFGSITQGPGIVNGVEQNGSLDNTPGNLLEMARSLVVANPSIGCAVGLHVGTRKYATNFASPTGKVVIVEVDPRNVVSVPYDCGDQKMRVSKYRVLEEAKSTYGRVYVSDLVADTITAGILNTNSPQRDSKGRFLKGGQTQKRDSSGRFISS